MIMKNILIEVQEETSVHDGYGSDGECYYRKIIYTTIKKIPNDIKKENYKEYILSKELIRPEINCHGSYYCELTEESKTNNLGKHDYNITILETKDINKNDNNVDSLEQILYDSALEHPY